MHHPFFTRHTIVLAWLVLGLLGVSKWSAAADGKERWVYAPANYQVDKEADRIITLMKRSKAAGYTHLLITDSKFARVPTLPERYFANVKRVRAAAAEVGIELVPALFGVGYSNDLLSNDPNLAEGLPVKDALFVVQNNEARHVPEPAVQLQDSALINRKAWGFIDDTLVSDSGALRSENPKTNARLSQRLKVAPFRQYHVSVQIRTKGFGGGKAEIKAIPAKGGQLNYTEPQVKADQDWTTHHITFNTLDHADVNLYFGVWGGHRGSLWWKDPKVEECGLVNVLRRPGAPFGVRDENRHVLDEGRDYEAFKDPKLGTVPYAGEYEPWHEAAALKLHGIADGTRLRVSYYHPHIIHTGQICACVSEPEFMALLRRQAADVAGLWQAGSYMMSHDEWRVMNWCAACLARKLTPGQIAADNVRSCSSFLRGVAPQARQFVWSDMFDPHHNAKASYYLVNGDLTGSWEGLDKDLIIVNWNSGKAVDSLRFFADRGHQQLIAGYYDGPVDRTRQWLEKGEGVKGIIGVMFTTWRGHYDDLEAFAKMLGEAGY